MFSSNTSQVSGDALFIEDVFNTGLYSASGGSETFSILGSVDMYTKGGLMWIKTRNAAASHSLIRPTLPSGGGLFCQSNTTAAQNSFSTTEFKVNSNNTVTMANGDINSGGSTYVSWNFAKSPKFFDVVTYTGNGTARTIAHNLGSVPGCIIVKCTNAAGKNWQVYHTSLGNASYINLNLTSASTSSSTIWNSTTPTSTVFSLGADGLVNDSGDQYVAYLFAHNAGGFGLTGTDNVISCGSFTTNSNGEATVSLGYEPQWMIAKRTDSTGNWFMIDTMRGWNVSGNNDVALFANTSAAEVSGSNYGNPTATGFFAEGGFANSATYIYIAIRRGPMKVPTSGTSVFAPTNVAQASAPYAYSGFPVDMAFRSYTPGGLGTRIMDRLRGASAGTQKELNTTSTAAETDTVSDFSFTYNTGISATSFSSNVFWMLRRAPSFFDEVCYTGDGASTRTLSHNLVVAPEWIILRKRNSSGYWFTYFNFGSTSCAIAQLEDTGAASTSDYSGIFSKMGGAPTSSSFFVTNPAFGETNLSGTDYVAYLFATCAGVSKVGSYTGTGTTKQVDCGFTGGARFVLIKRKDSTGDWYVWDSARGIVSGNDPYLLLNSTAAEVTNTDYIDTYSAGFEISSTAPAAINASGGTFIFLAIA